jgi:hypothetical protein
MREDEVNRSRMMRESPELERRRTFPPFLPPSFQTPSHQSSAGISIYFQLLLFFSLIFNAFPQWL